MVAPIPETPYKSDVQARHTAGRQKEGSYFVKIPFGLIRDKANAPKIYVFTLFTGRVGEHSKLIFEERELHGLIHREDPIGVFSGYRYKKKSRRIV